MSRDQVEFDTFIYVYYYSVRFRKSHFNLTNFEKTRGTSFDHLMKEKPINKFLIHLNNLTNILTNFKIHTIPQIMDRQFLKPNFTSALKSLKFKAFRWRLGVKFYSLIFQFY
jgi:hypothetical protein